MKIKKHYEIPQNIGAAMLEWVSRHLPSEQVEQKASLLEEAANIRIPHSGRTLVIFEIISDLENSN